MTKKIVKKVSKTVKKKKEDMPILEEGLALVKKLGNDVKTIGDAKDFLKKEVKKLDDKISKKEKSLIPKSVIDKFKQEIIDEFNPVIEKINPSAIRQHLKNDIVKTIELEISKVKSELSSKNLKEKREITQKLSSLESQILDNITKLQRSQKDFKKLEKSQVNLITSTIKEQSHNILESVNSKFINYNVEIENLKSQLGKESDADLVFKIDDINKELKQQQINLEKVKTEIKKELKTDSKEFAAVSAKIKKLEQKDKSMNALIGKLEDKLYENTKREVTQIEKTVQSTLKEIETNLEKTVVENNSSREGFDKEFKNIKTEIGKFEDKIKSIEQSSKNQIIKTLEKKIQELKVQTKNIETKANESFKLIEQEKKKQQNLFKEQFEKTTKDIEYLQSQQKHSIKLELENLESEFRIGMKQYLDEASVNFQKVQNLQAKESKVLFADLEKKNKLFIVEIEKKYDKLSKSFNNKNDQVLKEYAKDKGLIDTQIRKFKLEVGNLSTTYMKKLDKELAKIKSELDKGSDTEKNILKKLEQKTKKDINFFDTKLESAVVKVNKLIDNLKEEKRKETLFMKDKLNEIIDKFSKLATENKNNINSIEKKHQETINNEIKVIDEKLESTVVEYHKLIGDVEALKDDQTKYLEIKSKEFDEEFAKISNQRQEEVKFKIDNLVEALKTDILKSQEELNNEVARNMLTNNEFLSKIRLEQKEEKRALSEDIETKFVTSKMQFEETFNQHVKSFDDELAAKEKEFGNKIKDLYNEKEALVIELSSFKDEVSILTKDYVEKLDSELQNIKASEVNFESEKESFFAHLDNLVQVKKIELQDYSKNLETQIYELLKNQKESFDRNENSFRNNFTDKINNLREFTDKKLTNIEKRFVDKNLAYVKKQVDSQIEYFKLFEEKLEFKEETLSKQVEALEFTKTNIEEDFSNQFKALDNEFDSREKQLLEKIDSFKSIKQDIEINFSSKTKDLDDRFNLREKELLEKVELLKTTKEEIEADFSADFREINERSEERMVDLEKSFNKRFIDYDSSISQFKSVVVDEVEGLMREINQLVTNKFSTVDGNLKKMASLAHTTADNLVKLQKTKLLIDQEIRDLRDELSDVKLEVKTKASIDTRTENDFNIGSINSLVENMSDYENHLIDLIESLQSKGITNQNILNALVGKGHPKIYVTMVINNLKNLYLD